jgi:SAM-dependent methyltransferase
MSVGYYAYNKYPASCTFGGIKVLNVGSGQSVYKAKNVVNLDIEKYDGVDVVFDLSKQPLPFEDKTFDFIFANHILEHIENWGECFKDLVRVLKIGGTLEVWVPAEGSYVQHGPIGHINTVNSNSFTKTYTKNVTMASPIMNRLYASPIYKFLPDCIIQWMVEHLRNIAFETRFVFKRTS